MAEVTPQLELNVAEGERRRDVGMKSSADHAEQDAPGWNELAVAAIRAHAATNLYFTTEDVRAASPHVPPPVTPQAWGSAVRAARLAGVMVYHQHVKAQSPTVHRMDVKQWRSLVVRGQP